MSSCENKGNVEEGWYMVKEETKKQKRREKKETKQESDPLELVEPIEKDYVVLDSKTLKSMGIKVVSKRKRMSDEYKIIETEDLRGLTPRQYTIGRSQEQLVELLADAADESGVPKSTPNYAKAVLSSPKSTESVEPKTETKKNRRNRKTKKAEEDELNVTPLLNNISSSQLSFESMDKSVEYNCPDGPECSGADGVVNILGENEITLSCYQGLPVSNEREPLIENFKTPKYHAGSKKRLKSDKVNTCKQSENMKKDVPIENKVESKTKPAKENKIAQDKENVGKEKSNNKSTTKSKKEKSSSSDAPKKSKGKHKRTEQNRPKKDKIGNSDSTEDASLFQDPIQAIFNQLLKVF